MDIISILKAMLHPAVRRPVAKNEPKGKTDWIDSVEQLEAQWKKLAKERNTVVANENQEMRNFMADSTYRPARTHTPPFPHSQIHLNGDYPPLDPPEEGQALLQRLY